MDHGGGEKRTDGRRQRSSRRVVTSADLTWLMSMCLEAQRSGLRSSEAPTARPRVLARQQYAHIGCQARDRDIRLLYTGGKATLAETSHTILRVRRCHEAKLRSLHAHGAVTVDSYVRAKSPPSAAAPVPGRVLLV